MREKCLPVYLPKDLYERLEAIAEAEDRDPTQHARWLIRRALEVPTPELATSGAAGVAA